MKQDVKQVDAGRRNFMSSAAATGLGTFAAVTLPASTIAAPALPVDQEDRPKGYQLSQHVLDYYKSAAS